MLFRPQNQNNNKQYSKYIRNYILMSQLNHLWRRAVSESEPGGNISLDQHLTTIRRPLANTKPLPLTL